MCLNVVSDRHYCTIYWFYFSTTFCFFVIVFFRPQSPSAVLVLGVAASASVSPSLVHSFHCLGLGSSASAPTSIDKKCLDYITGMCYDPVSVCVSVRLKPVFYPVFFLARQGQWI